MLPSIGAMSIKIKPAPELAMPKYKVLSLAATPLAQYSLKKMGKKPAMTVVEKAELAQS